MKFPLAHRLFGSGHAEQSGADEIGNDFLSAGDGSPSSAVLPKPPSTNLVASGVDEAEASTTEFGRIEKFDGRYMVGWYFDHLTKSHALQIKLDDEILCGTLANLSRMDVVAANPKAPEKCGFFVDLIHHEILRKCPDLESLYARMKVMPLSGKQLAHCYDSPFSAALKPAVVNRKVSNFDGVENGVATGWAVPTNGNIAPLIHILIDGRMQGSARTSLYREDVGGMTGFYNSGFAFFISPRFLDGGYHSIECHFADTGEHIFGSPKDVLLKSTSSDEINQAAELANGLVAIEDQVRRLREKINFVASSGVSYFANYMFYQDIVQTHKSNLARLKKREIAPGAALFSIVMPTYKSDQRILEKAIDSVVAQTDILWELVISDSASSEPLRAFLRTRAQLDDRIKVIFNDKHLGISDNTNVALNAASGEYVGFMDHDDELAPEAISLNRAAFSTGLYDIVYSDEDKIDPDGNFVEPHYKSSFDMDLLLTMNYMCHLVFVRKDKLFETELNRRHYDGAQDWDLLLQLMQRVPHQRVGHIPRVLYHWRMIPGSTAMAIGEKGYAVQVGLDAVKKHLTEIGAEADAGPLKGDLPYVDVKWHASKGSKVSLIIPTKDRIDLITNCVNSILQTVTDVDLEIIIVDNNSSTLSSASFQSLCADVRVKILKYHGDFNYSAINNFAAREASGEYLLLLNNDVFFTQKGWLLTMLGYAQRSDVGAVGLKLLYPDNTIQHCGVVLGVGGVAGHAFVRLPYDNLGYFARTACNHEVSAVTAACLLVSKKSFLAVGGLDENDLTVAFNDVDFCIKLQMSGLRNILVATAFAYHAESLSRGYEDTLEKIARFERETATMRSRWGEKLASDRFYSPNFDLYHAPYTVIDLASIADQEFAMTKHSICR